MYTVLTDIPSLFTAQQLAEIKRLTPPPLIPSQQHSRPLQGKWVPARSVVTDDTSGTFKKLQLYEPRDIPAGWFFLGQSVSNTSALIVRKSDNWPDVTFCSVGKWDKVWFASALGRTFSMWNAYPEDSSNYAPLSSCFVASSGPPAVDPRMVCINKKYLVKGSIGVSV